MATPWIAAPLVVLKRPITGVRISRSASLLSHGIWGYSRNRVNPSHWRSTIAKTIRVASVMFGSASSRRQTVAMVSTHWRRWLSTMLQSMDTDSSEFCKACNRQRRPMRTTQSGPQAVKAVTRPAARNFRRICARHQA